MYNPDNQYRCIAIRGKAKSLIDDLLPAYASIIEDLTPCTKNHFDQAFDSALLSILSSSSAKTIANHRTEIAGKLFGMFMIDENEMVVMTERTQKFLATNDQPAFFKDMCYKFQSISGMDSAATLKEKADHHISIRPMCYIVWLLSEAKNNQMILTDQDLGYYLLNNEDALAGRATPQEILDAIKKDRAEHKKKKVFAPGKSSSYYWQHIREQMTYLELANLIEVTQAGVFLNASEQKTINRFVLQAQTPLSIDPNKYDLTSSEGRSSFEFDWTHFFGKVSDVGDDFETTLESLGLYDQANQTFANTTEIGDEGERIALAYERERVAKLDPRLMGRVSLFGKIHGLGYDILSVMAASRGQEAEFAKYIEVKTTKRVTEPDFDNEKWVESFNITKNEWNAMTQQREFYSIYRVYLCKKSIVLAVINNPRQQIELGAILLTPLNFRVDFGSRSVSEVIDRSVANAS